MVLLVTSKDIKTMEWWDKLIIADYCWIIKRNLNNIEHDRETRKKIFTIVLIFAKVLFLLLVY